VGADIAGEDRAGLHERWDKYQAIHARQLTLWDFPKPLIAAVHGYCLGRGLELALWCDIVIAAEDARLGQPEVRDGSFVGSILPWVVGPQQAKWIMWTGDQMDASEAHRIGLVTRVVPQGRALGEAITLARRLAHVPPVTARSVKRWINGIAEQAGLRTLQAAAPAFSALIAGMAPGEKGTEELDRIRREQGLKAYLEARDKPFMP
jgi:enoyl-CoA hydratase